jgi:hypothetical protein
MRVLVLLFALISMPVLAADYTPWLDSDDALSACQQLAQYSAPAPAPAAPSQTPPPVYQDPSKPVTPKRHPGDYCCVHCRYNEVPCAGECLPPMKEGKKSVCTAKTGDGCACRGKP